MAHSRPTPRQLKALSWPTLVPLEADSRLLDMGGPWMGLEWAKSGPGIRLGWAWSEPRVGFQQAEGRLVTKSNKIQTLSQVCPCPVFVQSLSNWQWKDDGQ